jgi:hypothetical protein
VNGKNLFDRKVLRTALKILNTELHPDHVLPDASPEYRKGLAEALFYKVSNHTCEMIILVCAD